MAIDVPIVPAAPPAPTFTTAAETAEFDPRWAPWHAIAAARDRAFRRKMAVVVPMIIVAAVITYALVGR